MLRPHYAPGTPDFSSDTSGRRRKAPGFGQNLPGVMERPRLAAIAGQDDRGDFEQESLGPPAPGGWPFG